MSNNQEIPVLDVPPQPESIPSMIVDGRIRFRMWVGLGRLVAMAGDDIERGIEALNELAESALCGLGFIGLQDLGFSVVGHRTKTDREYYCDGAILIEVNALLEHEDLYDFMRSQGLELQGD